MALSTILLSQSLILRQNNRSNFKKKRQLSHHRQLHKSAYIHRLLRNYSDVTSFPDRPQGKYRHDFNLQSARWTGCQSLTVVYFTGIGSKYTICNIYGMHCASFHPKT